mgnify:CR=1 FL=1
MRGNVNSVRSLIVEDIREADILLRSYGCACDRITHNELLSSSGTVHTGKLLRGDYDLLWISSPHDWHARKESKKTTTHWQRIQNWLEKAMLLGMVFVLFGPPGYLWKVPNIQEVIKQSNAFTVKMRLCHFGCKFDAKDPRPSGSYLQFATTAKVSTRLGQCNCKLPITEHTLDWYGRSEAQAQWRQQVTFQFMEAVIQHIYAEDVRTPCTNSRRGPKGSLMIRDNMTPPFPTNVATTRPQGRATSSSSYPVNNEASSSSSPGSSSHNQSDNVFPTESRLRAKERAKDLKARGLKPKKRQKVTEPGNDDCGDDISGLGKDITLLMQDVTQEEIESSDDEVVFIAIPVAIHDAHTNIYSAIAHLCYGKHNTVDLLELCGGEARISHSSEDLPQVETWTWSPGAISVTPRYNEPWTTTWKRATFWLLCCSPTAGPLAGTLTTIPL